MVEEKLLNSLENIENRIIKIVTIQEQNFKLITSYLDELNLKIAMMEAKAENSNNNIKSVMNCVEKQNINLEKSYLELTEIIKRRTDTIRDVLINEEVNLSELNSYFKKMRNIF